MLQKHSFITLILICIHYWLSRLCSLYLVIDILFSTWNHYLLLAFVLRKEVCLPGLHKQIWMCSSRLMHSKWTRSPFLSKNDRNNLAPPTELLFSTQGVCYSDFTFASHSQQQSHRHEYLSPSIISSFLYSILYLTLFIGVFFGVFFVNDN